MGVDHVPYFTVVKRPLRIPVILELERTWASGETSEAVPREPAGMNSGRKNENTVGAS